MYPTCPFLAQVTIKTQSPIHITSVHASGACVGRFFCVLVQSVVAMVSEKEVIERMDGMKEEIKFLKELLSTRMKDTSDNSSEENKKEKKERNLTEKKSFLSVPKYAGKHAEYEDWRFKAKLFLGEENGYMEIIREVEKLKTLPSSQDIAKIFHEHIDVDVDKEKMNKQIYQFLCYCVTDNALSVVKNLFDHDNNGFLGWWKLGFECTALTVQKMQALTSAVFKPKRCRRYADVTAAVDEWELVIKKFEDAEETKVSSHMRMLGIKQIVPEELEKDIERSSTLGKYEDVKAYVMEQVTIRKDRKNVESSGPVEMLNKIVPKVLAMMGKEQDVSENMQHGQDHDYECGMCGEEEEREHEESEESRLTKMVFSMVKGGKGGKGFKGKGQFQGECGYCGVYGHKLSECRKKDRDMQEIRKGGGKGGKGKDNWYGKGGYGGFGGKGGGQGWQGFNLGKGFGKGKGMGKGAAFGFEWQNPTAQAAEPGRNAWHLSLTPTVAPPPGLSKTVKTTNSFKAFEEEEEDQFEVLNYEDLKKEGNDFTRVLEAFKTNLPQGEQEFPAIDGNYSKKSVRNRGKMPHVTKDKYKPLNLFNKMPEKKELNALPTGYHRQEDGWIKLRGVMDSGASCSVIHPSMCPDYEVQPSAGSLAGQKFTSASGDEIPNLGQQLLDVETMDGRSGMARYQSADVTRPLNSITEICDAGGEDGQYVIFSKYGGAVINLDHGRQTPFDREDDIYCMDLWVKPKQKATSGFPRPGA